MAKPGKCPHSKQVDDLIARLDRAVAHNDVARRCDHIADALSDACSGELRLPCSFVRTADSCYARRLLHKDPNDRYSIVVMVWDGGQGTPVHDHAGTWCVECVYKGRIKVTSFDLIQGANREIRFRRERDVLAGVGEAGKLIPPFDYHIIENNDDVPAVTIHVYGGELKGCHTFTPRADGCYEKHWHDSYYTP